MKTIVFVKQILDPDIEPTLFRIDPRTNSVVPPTGSWPRISLLDELAVEVALRLKDAHGGVVTVISLCNEPFLDVLKKPLAMGADELVLLQGSELEGGDAFSTAQALAASAKKVGDYDIILCGSQAGDWDNGQVGLYVAEALGIPCITGAWEVQVEEETVRVSRIFGDSQETVEASLPALVTVGSDVGRARYPGLRGIMAAAKKQPQIWTFQDLDVDPSDVGVSGAMTRVRRLYVGEKDGECEIIQGATPAEAGEKLANRLRELRII